MLCGVLSIDTSSGTTLSSECYELRVWDAADDEALAYVSLTHAPPLPHPMKHTCFASDGTRFVLAGSQDNEVLLLEDFKSSWTQVEASLGSERAK